MAVKVKVPGALRAKTGGANQVEVEAQDVAQALECLQAMFPALSTVLRDESGTLRPRVNLYVNDVHVRFLQGLETPLHDGDRVYVVPIVMGG